jgi:hypothetical protein
MPPLHTGCSSAWESARVGSERPLVQIQPSRLQRRVPRGRIRREGPPVRGEGSGWVRPHRPRDPCLGPRSLAPLSPSEGVRVASAIPYPLSLPHHLTALQPPQGDISRAYSSTSHTSSPPTIKHPPWPFQSHKRSESPPLCHVNAPDCPRRHDLLKVKGGIAVNCLGYLGVESRLTPVALGTYGVNLGPWLTRRWGGPMFAGINHLGRGPCTR